MVVVIIMALAAIVVDRIVGVGGLLRLLRLLLIIFLSLFLGLLFET
jgi:hypothetical protein